MRKTNCAREICGQSVAQRAMAAIKNVFFILETISDAQTEALVTERHVIISEQINRPPIDGDLERNLRNVPFHTDLPSDTRIHTIVVLGMRTVVESQIGTGAHIEVAEAVAGKNEVVDTHDIETVGIPTEVQFTEVGTEAVLIGELATIADTGADGTRLRGCHHGKAEDGRDQNQSLFHNTEDLIGEIILT